MCARTLPHPQPSIWIFLNFQREGWSSTVTNMSAGRILRKWHLLPSWLWLKPENSEVKVRKWCYVWMGLKMQIKKLTLFQNAILHFKSAEYKPRMQFEMKNVRNCYIFSLYITKPSPYLFPQWYLREKGYGLFPCRDKFNSHRALFCNYYSYTTHIYVFFLSRTNLITGLRLTRSVSIVIVVTVTSKTASSISACLALQFFTVF